MAGIASIERGDLKISVHLPSAEDGYYRGTRFDWAGVFAAIEYKGVNIAEEWFEKYSPVMHDAVCGPAEEFSAIGFDDAAPGGKFLKIGVGMLERPDQQDYDRFKLYHIVNPGYRSGQITDNSVILNHSLSDSVYGYNYVKEIALTRDNSFSIRHKLKNTGTATLKGDFYNHNFFTLGLLVTGPDRKISFPFIPEGNWRAEYDSVGLTGNGIAFSRRLEKGESVYMGNVHQQGNGLAGSPNAFTLSEMESGITVNMECPIPMTRMVFWSNHRIACLEPYIDFSLPPGETLDFTIDYKIAVL